jgi:hypothetical protein
MVTVSNLLPGNCSAQEEGKIEEKIGRYTGLSIEAITGLRENAK